MQTLIQKTITSSFAWDIISEMEMRLSQPRFNPNRTAIARTSATLPARLGLQYMQGEGLDFGCGRSKDAGYLAKNGLKCAQYDPFYCPLGLSIKKNMRGFDFILVSYVLNVLPRTERIVVSETLSRLLNPSGHIIVGLRDDFGSIKPNWTKFDDGYVTTASTFQAFFSEQDTARVEELFPNYKITRIGRGTWLVR